MSIGQAVVALHWFAWNLAANRPSAGGVIVRRWPAGQSGKSNAVCRTQQVYGGCNPYCCMKAGGREAASRQHLRGLVPVLEWRGRGWSCLAVQGEKGVQLNGPTACGGAPPFCVDRSGPGRLSSIPWIPCGDAPADGDAVNDLATTPDRTADQQAARYARRRYLMAVVHVVVGLGFLLVMLFWGTRPLAEWVKETVGGDFLQVGLYTALFLLLYQLIIFPLDYYTGFVLEHQFGLSTQAPPDWLRTKVKQSAVSLVFLVLMLEFVYWVIRRAPTHWWVYAGLGWIAVTVLLTRLFPVVILPLFYRTEPLEEPELMERLSARAEEAKLAISGVHTFDLSRDTKKANAALVGWGSTRRVLLGDTVIEQFTAAEVEAIFTHELGHHVKLHLWKEVMLGGVTAVLGFALCQAVMDAVAPKLDFQVSDIASLPLLVLVLMGFALLLLPLQNGYSRRLERESDIYAARRTSEPRALLTAFAKLARLNLTHRRPHWLIELIFYSHPSIEKRMALVARELTRIEGTIPPGKRAGTAGSSPEDNP